MPPASRHGNPGFFVARPKSCRVMPESYELMVLAIISYSVARLLHSRLHYEPSSRKKVLGGARHHCSLVCRPEVRRYDRATTTLTHGPQGDTSSAECVNEATTSAAGSLSVHEDLQRGVAQAADSPAHLRPIEAMLARAADNGEVRLKERLARDHARREMRPAI